MSVLCGMEFPFLYAKPPARPDSPAPRLSVKTSETAAGGPQNIIKHFFVYFKNGFVPCLFSLRRFSVSRPVCRGTGSDPKFKCRVLQAVGVSIFLLLFLLICYRIYKAIKLRSGKERFRYTPCNTLHSGLPCINMLIGSDGNEPKTPLGCRGVGAETTSAFILRNPVLNKMC